MFYKVRTHSLYKEQFHSSTSKEQNNIHWYCNNITVLSTRGLVKYSFSIRVEVRMEIEADMVSL